MAEVDAAAGVTLGVPVAAPGGGAAGRAGLPACCAEIERTPHMIATAPAINDRFNMNRLPRGRTALEAATACAAGLTHPTPPPKDLWTQ